MKNTVKRLSRIFTCALGACVITAPLTLRTVHAQDGTTSATQPLIRYDFTYMNEQEEMPVLGYMGVPGNAIVNSVAPSFLTRANIQAYKDAGFNILSGLYEKVPLYNAEVYKALEICEELQLTYFVCDNTYRSSFESPQTNVPTKEYFMAEMSDDFYFDSPAFGGIAVRDEPSIHCYDQMGSVNSALTELTGESKVMYTNLYPKGANQFQLGYSTEKSPSTWEQYEQYVTDFITKVKPSILPYDCYTMLKPNSHVVDVNGKNDVGNYMRSLSLFNRYSKQYNVPFWVTVASHDHIYTRKNIPLKQTQWTVNTSLAYGAKGIQYYTYWNDGAGSSDMSSWAEDGNNRSEGLVSPNGALTDNYYRIQKINKQIQLIDHVLMTAEHRGIMQFGTQYVKLIAQDVLYGFGSLRDIQGDAFVGCFSHGANDVYYIVNNSVDAGIQTFKADFAESVNVRLTGLRYVGEENPNGQIVKENTTSVGFNLSGGEGVLLEVLR